MHTGPEISWQRFLKGRDIPPYQLHFTLVKLLFTIVPFIFAMITVVLIVIALLLQTSTHGNLDSNFKFTPCNSFTT